MPPVKRPMEALPRAPQVVAVRSRRQRKRLVNLARLQQAEVGRHGFLRRTIRKRRVLVESLDQYGAAEKYKRQRGTNQRDGRAQRAAAWDWRITTLMQSFLFPYGRSGAGRFNWSKTWTGELCNCDAQLTCALRTLVRVLG